MTEEKQIKKPAAKKPAGKGGSPTNGKTSAPATGRRPAVRRVARPARVSAQTPTEGRRVIGAGRPSKARSGVAQRLSVRRSGKTNRPDGYFYAVGRRKRAIAQVKLWVNDKKPGILVNGRDYKSFFPTFELQTAVMAPLKAVGLDGGARLEVKIVGGGARGQAEAIRHGVSRALTLINPDYRLTLKKMGFLMRDPREKERKKFGLKKARKAPQWAKR